MMRFDTKGLKELKDNLKQASSYAESLAKDEVNKITDRHLARVVKNTPAGDSPDSPNLKNRWDRSGVIASSSGVSAEVFNPTEYASYFEFGHRQTVGKYIFIELTQGAKKYGQKAKEIKKGKYAGKWGIFVKLKKPFVKGRFVLTDSEEKSKKELEAAAKRISKKIEEALR